MRKGHTTGGSARLGAKSGALDRERGPKIEFTRAPACRLGEHGVRTGRAWEGGGERLRGAAEEGPGLGGTIPRVPGQEIGKRRDRRGCTGAREGGRPAGNARVPRVIGRSACPAPPPRSYRDWGQRRTPRAGCQTRGNIKFGRTIFEFRAQTSFTEHSGTPPDTATRSGPRPAQKFRLISWSAPLRYAPLRRASRADVWICHRQIR